jgi:predicted nucleic acid-binding protein
VILLDTNVISELARPSPEPAVEKFLRLQPPESVFTSAVCQAEIRYGLARLAPGRRREELTRRVLQFLSDAFPGQILPFDSACAALYGEIRANRGAAGKPIAVADGMIAATAGVHGAMLATRNTADFEGSGIELVNPWTAG